MKQHNYKAGDKVRIIGNKVTFSPGIRHNYDIGDIVTVKGVDKSDDTLWCHRADGLHSWVFPRHVELVEADKPASFNRDDIKAGYLLEVKEGGTGRTFYMTVVPTKYEEPDDHLGCVNPGRDWWCLCEFNRDTLTHKGYTIMRVYGSTSNRLLLSNTTEDRELLWERQEEPKVVEMTVAEISEKLGFEVKIVKEK